MILEWVAWFPFFDLLSPGTILKFPERPIKRQLGTVSSPKGYEQFSYGLRRAVGTARRVSIASPPSQSPIGVIKRNHTLNLASRIKNAHLARTKSGACFRYEEITRRVKGDAMRIVKTGSERALRAGGSEHKNCIIWPVA